MMSFARLPGHQLSFFHALFTRQTHLFLAMPYKQLDRKSRALTD
jgi:hypothetical protein